MPKWRHRVGMMKDVALPGAPQIRLARPDAIVVALFSIGVPLLLSFSADLFNDGDTSWHLAAGRMILDNWSVPDVDPFSFTFSGQPWVAHEWLAEALMAFVHREAGWGGLSVLSAGAVGMLLLLIGSKAARHMPPVYVACVLTALVLVLGPFILARPHVLAWPLLAGWTLLLLRARDAGKAPALAASALMLVWANLHGSFLFGLLLIGPLALEALLEAESKPRAMKEWGLFGVASLAASLMTPHGIHGWLFPFQVSSMETLSLIQEWRPTNLMEMKGFTAVLLGTVAFAVLKRPKVPVIRLLLLLALLILAFQHVRHQAVLAIVGALILVEPIGRAVHGEQNPGARGLSLAPLAAALLLVLVLARLMSPIEQPQSATNPAAAIASLDDDLRSKPVLNSYSFGGPLILNGIKPYVDGRADMYGDDFMRDYSKITGGDPVAFGRAVSRWNIGWTILAPGEKLVASLDRNQGWRRIYADRWAVIHVRATP